MSFGAMLTILFMLIGIAFKQYLYNYYMAFTLRKLKVESRSKWVNLIEIYSIVFNSGKKIKINNKNKSRFLEDGY